VSLLRNWVGSRPLHPVVTVFNKATHESWMQTLYCPLFSWCLPSLRLNVVPYALMSLANMLCAGHSGDRPGTLFDEAVDALKEMKEDEKGCKQM